jgi:predicted DNA-binding helix-hairpin-helix protein
MVGAAGETDREIMETTWGLYRKMEARRVYFSAFQPVPGTPLENDPACPLLREHRLYQCDFLVRKYGFEFEELPFDRNGNLSMDEDPKTAWARRHRELFPIEINSAPLELLLRVPGIGPASAGRIVRARRERAIRSAAQLASTGAAAARAAPYVLLGGRAMPRQEELFKPPTP